ncbi:MAG: hypothetical protein ACRCST_06465 [Turicibacter sp.]
MNIIKKYKKTFISIVILAMIIGVLPSLTVGQFGSVETSTESYEITEDLSQQVTSRVTNVSYQLNDLKTDSTIKYPKQFTLFGRVSIGMGGSTGMKLTKLQIIYESYLPKGTKFDITLTVDELRSGIFYFIILDDEGEVETYKCDRATNYPIEFKTKKTGNYAILMYFDDADGSYSINTKIKKPLLHF